jgi:simple sugar transport system ATP-binding protein
MAALLEAKGISKYFGAITALHDVNFHVEQGEVLGVVGDNGAGKSTLMKILSGLFVPSEGELLFDGRPVKFASPKDARKLGIEMVYQDFALAGNCRREHILGATGRTFAAHLVDHKARQRAPSISTPAHPRESVDQKVGDFRAASGKPSPSPAPPPSRPRS